jgi:transcriptional regulator GlxA family with amidase domain
VADFALLVPRGAFHSSVGAFLDGFALAREQVERVLGTNEPLRMETQLRLLTADGQPAVMADGRRLTADRGLDGAGSYDLVHLPSFRIGGGADVLRERLHSAEPLLSWLKRQFAEGALISASGSAVFLLAEAGLIGSYAVPLPRPLVPMSRTLFPRLLIDERRGLIEHGRIIIGNGLATDQTLVTRIIERTISAETGRWLASVAGSDRLTDDELSEDALVANAQLWLEQRFTEDVRIGELAQELSTSHQTLTRRFKAALGVRPKDYVQRLRIGAARRMLRRTNRPIEQIAAMVGYRDPRSFRTVFREETGMSPSAHRDGGRKAGR